ncbi:MAG: bifunctional phosphopantothenoylcysteine decarboxylase/phosphopantothenate--cysteine ligase CoaBC [Campylobacterales bacterium]
MRVLIGVTGSIAIYKSCELVRLFKRRGHEVRVVMSEEATRFISPLTFEGLTGTPVLHRGSESWSSGVDHISYSRWAQLYIISPATVTTLNRARAGIGDTLPLQVYLATQAPTLFAPAANTHMILHPTAQQSLEELEVVAPTSGELACGEIGIGKMADPEEIYWAGLRLVRRRKFWEGKRVTITGGGSREPIDDVRFIGNYSSGKMGEALALAYYTAGAEVTLISSQPHPTLPRGIRLIPVERGEEYRREILESRPDYLVMAAAIVDFKPEYTPGKLKKEEIGEELVLKLKRNIDVLTSLKGTPFKKIGFKAEMDLKRGKKAAIKALKEKGLDGICLNYLSQYNFGSDRNRVTFITPNWEVEIPEGTKLQVAEQIVELSELL